MVFQLYQDKKEEILDFQYVYQMHSLIIILIIIMVKINHLLGLFQKTKNIKMKRLFNIKFVQSIL